MTRQLSFFSFDYKAGLTGSEEAFHPQTILCLDSGHVLTFICSLYSGQILTDGVRLDFASDV